MKYCADCAWMGECDNKDGKFPCENPRSSYKVVSARMSKCNAFTDILNSKRGEGRKEELMRISKSHGYYIVTAVCKILGLDTDNIYMEYFMYLRDVIMPNLEYGKEWIEDYEEYGPKIAEAIENSENREEIAGSILNECLNPFVELMIKCNVDEAITIYQEMVEQQKVKFGFSPASKNLTLIDKMNK